MPSAAIEKTPLAPAAFVCGTKVCGLSTSVIVNVPPVLSGALVSFSAAAALEMTAALFAPLIVTWTVVVVPSAEATVKVHRSRLMHKMKARSLPELSRMADKLKLVPEEPLHS